MWIVFTVLIKGPSTLATLFNHMWPRIVADPSTLGRHVAATCMLCMQTLCLWRGRATACGTLEPQPVAHLSHKLQCARQSWKIMVSYGNKYPRHNARPHVVEQSGQCARTLTVTQWSCPNRIARCRSVFWKSFWRYEQQRSHLRGTETICATAGGGGEASANPHKGGGGGIYYLARCYVTGVRAFVCVWRRVAYLAPFWDSR